MKELLESYERCKNVERLGMCFKHRGYNLLEHQFLVGVLFMKIAEKENISYDLKVLDLILNHDLLESHTQDLSYEVKNFSNKTKSFWEAIEDEIISGNSFLEKYSDANIKQSLNSIQYELFKCCDLLDLWLFLKKEVEVGNRDKHILEIIPRCEKLILGKFSTIDDIFETYGN